MPIIIQDFSVGRPTTYVWDLFQDVPQVVACMPGAELTETTGPNSYKGRLIVKLGPVSASFEGEASVEEVDATCHRAVIRSKGVDKRGGSRGSAVVTYELRDSDGSTDVHISADVTLQGRLAQFGRTGLLAEVSKTLTADFAACLESKLNATTAEEAASVRVGEVKGLRIFFVEFWRWTTRAFRRGPRPDRSGRGPRPAA